jgi:hypothetical protein
MKFVNAVVEIHTQIVLKKETKLVESEESRLDLKLAGQSCHLKVVAFVVLLVVLVVKLMVKD